MHRRTLLATATLTALLLTTGSLQTTPTGVEVEPAPHASSLQTMQSSEVPAAPRWGAAFGWGIKWNLATLVICAAFTGPGALACGLTGAA